MVLQILAGMDRPLSGKNNLTENFSHVPQRVRDKEENYYDSLSAQLAALEKAGFREVDSHYRCCLFAFYAGRVPSGKCKFPDFPDLQYIIFLLIFTCRWIILSLF